MYQRRTEGGGTGWKWVLLGDVCIRGRIYYWVVCVFFFYFLFFIFYFLFYFIFFFYHNCVLKREWLITGCFLYKRKGLITGY